MIYDKIENAPQYFHLNNLFALAFYEDIQEGLENSPAGTIDLVGDDLRLIVVECDGSKSSESVAEAHKSHIDIQIAIKGSYKIGITPLEKCTSPIGEYNAEEDAILYDDNPETELLLEPGYFIILFPEDVHRVYSSNEPLKKAIFKVKI